MDDIIDTYESVPIHEIERILSFMEETWLQGFPVVKKEDGRSEEQLLTHAAILLLIFTGCLPREEKDNIVVIKQIVANIEQGGRLAQDANDFLAYVRPAERYIRKSVVSRKQKAKA